QRGRKMSATVKPIPEGHQGAIPYLTVSDASKAIAFYKAAFGAAEVLCIEHGGKVGHAELEIGEARIMLCDEFPDHDALSPQTIGGTPVMIHLYVEDVDAFTARAIGAGIKGLRPVTANSRTLPSIAGGSRLIRKIFRTRNFRIAPPLCLAATWPEEAPLAPCGE